MILSRWNTYISWILKFTMSVLFIYTVYQKNFLGSIGVFGDFIFSFLPFFLSRNADKNLPWTLDFSVTLAFFLQALAITFNLNHIPAWFFWDDLQHFIGSIAVGMLAFHLIFTLEFTGRIIMGVAMSGFFVFMITMAIGGIWEIAEFYSDKFIGTYTQLSIVDTINDLQMDALGGLITAIIGMRFLNVKRKELDELSKLRELQKDLAHEKILRKRKKFLL